MVKILATIILFNSLHCSISFSSFFWLTIFVSLNIYSQYRVSLADLWATEKKFKKPFFVPEPNASTILALTEVADPISCLNRI